ncbi:hypothetical protein TOPH_01947 [Tolypocladium ophioglossoides CBS 100239]|uniref:Uncharacterized protein n=1 Tax=Tolypocladium ophioglossoides (strain CBS 100239) TaxID=1163406 RepID=A0A0L0NIA1_TOLOC|nr:hypothetical protein TOPH_01947 [Tolypocladium ophioglossoides CBS 100239]
MSATLVNTKQVLPTQENLSEVLDKLLAIFEVESILDGRKLPLHPLQREFKDSPDSRHILRPISGNDFHVSPSFTVSPPSWGAILQLEQTGWCSNICVPLCHIEQHPRLDQNVTGIQKVEQAATLLRAAWPDASIGPSRRRQLGLDFYDSASASYQLFRWLASKQLNPISEGIFLSDFLVSEGRRFEPLRQVKRGLVVRPSPEEDWKHISVSSHTVELDRRHQHDPDTHFWSFSGPENWVISLPVVSTILLLMINPTKKVEANSDCPDREISWCLDSLHGFCRRKGPEEGSRNLSWSQGTFPDCWMYLHFIFYYFCPHDNQPDESGRWKGSGIQCDRRNIKLPVRRDGSMETFRERRFWFGMRTSTTYQSEETDVKEHQATVAFVMGDSYHIPVDLKNKAWLKRGLESPDGASGVALFHMILWSGMDEWSRGWNCCLDHLDGLHEVKIEDLDDANSKLSTLKFDGKFAKVCSMTAQLLKIFRKHIDVLPQSLDGMRNEWERTYPAIDADLLERFDEETQATLLRNWDTLIMRVNELHSNLVKRIEKKAADLRDSTLLAKAFKS